MTSVIFYLSLAAAGVSVALIVWVLSNSAAKTWQEAKAEGTGDKAAHKIWLISKMAGWHTHILSRQFALGLARKFVAMGRPDITPEEFVVYQELSALLFTILAVVLLVLMKKPLAISILFGLFGFFMPYIWLTDQIKKRHQKIVRALPYALDLLTLSVEAGLDFQAAVAKVVEKGQEGPLKEEFGIMLGEIRLGKTREEALRNMADRVQLPQLSTFVSNLIQADRMGTSLGKVLRIQSTQMRIERTHRAEKLAQEAPVKLLFPLVACIFPTVFMILFGPIVYRWLIAK